MIPNQESCVLQIATPTKTFNWNVTLIHTTIHKLITNRERVIHH